MPLHLVTTIRLNLIRKKIQSISSMINLRAITMRDGTKELRIMAGDLLMIRI
jgi:hypothetical protein